MRFRKIEGSKHRELIKREIEQYWGGGGGGGGGQVNRGSASFNRQIHVTCDTQKHNRL